MPDIELPEISQVNSNEVQIVYPCLTRQILHHMPTTLMSKKAITNKGSELASKFNSIEKPTLADSVQNALDAAKEDCKGMILRKEGYQKIPRTKLISKNEIEGEEKYWKQATNKGQITAKPYVE